MAIGWDLAAGLRVAVLGVRFGVLRFESVLAFWRFAVLRFGVLSRCVLPFWRFVLLSAVCVLRFAFRRFGS